MAEHTYYNDIEPYCCKVLSKNIERGYLPGGYVDGRDIRELQASNLVGYQHIHLFAGIGGFPLGIRRANVPSHLRIITGGFPCQDISNAGKRAGITGERSGLWKEMRRLICDVRPDYVCVENVAALLSRGIDTVLGDLAQIGYDAEWACLQASDFGAPHQRERIFIVAYPNGIRESRQKRNLANRQRGTTFSAGVCQWEDRAEMAYSNSQRREECNSSPCYRTLGQSTGFVETIRGTRQPQPTMGRVLDGLSEPMDGDRGRNGGMDGDNVIINALASGGIEVDYETGRIYSRRIRGKEGQCILLSGTSNHAGYTVHKIAYEGIKKIVRAHRIVWIAAHGAIPEGLMIDHINRDRTDNRLVNLRLVDAKGNAENRPDRFGEDNFSAKITQEQVREIHLLRQMGMDIRGIAQEIGISKSQVHNIVTGKCWSHQTPLPPIFQPVDLDLLDRYRWPAGPGEQQHNWEPPRITTTKQPHRVARLKALGNAIVPQIAEYIGRCIVAREMRSTEAVS